MSENRIRRMMEREIKRCGSTCHNLTEDFKFRGLLKSNHTTLKMYEADGQRIKAGDVLQLPWFTSPVMVTLPPSPVDGVMWCAVLPCPITATVLRPRPSTPDSFGRPSPTLEVVHEGVPVVIHGQSQFIVATRNGVQIGDTLQLSVCDDRLAVLNLHNDCGVSLVTVAKPLHTPPDL